MASLISPDEVRKLAVLSSLNVQEQEIAGIMHQLNDVLSYAARVGEIVVDVPDTRAVRVNVLREDRVGASCAHEVLAQAPEEQEHYFVVPAVLEK